MIYMCILYIPNQQFTWKVGASPKLVQETGPGFHNLKGHSASSDRKVASQRITDPTKILQTKTLETTKAQNGAPNIRSFKLKKRPAWKGKSHYRLKHQSHTGKAEQPMVWNPNFSISMMQIPWLSAPKQNTQDLSFSQEISSKHLQEKDI